MLSYLTHTRKGRGKHSIKGSARDDFPPPQDLNFWLASESDTFVRKLVSTKVFLFKVDRLRDPLISIHQWCSLPSLIKRSDV